MSSVEADPSNISVSLAVYFQRTAWIYHRIPYKLLGVMCCFLLTVAYIPLYFTINTTTAISLPPIKTDIKNNGDNFAWDVQTTRDLTVYIRPSNFTATIPNGLLCSNRTGETFLLIIVCSAVNNFEARNAIRESWMSVRNNQSIVITGNLTGAEMRMGFLLGETTNQTLQEDIDMESETYGDIIQESFIDSYQNLTVKSVMLLKWVTAFCPQAKFILKTDDDMFVNVAVLAHYLDQPEIRNRNDMLVGSLFCKVIPHRDRHSKWYSPRYMFEGKRYPDYVSGTGYVISGAVVPRLLQTALRVRLFHLEDVFVTGIVAQKAELIPENVHLFSYLKQPLDNPCLYRKLITSHGLTPTEMLNVWSEIQNPSVDCSNATLPKIGDPKLKHCRKSKRIV